MKIRITESQYKVLTEQYDEDYYNQILDLYNESGFNGMSEDEIEYLKSGGKSEIPKRFNDTEEDKPKTKTNKGIKIIQTPPDDYTLIGSLKDLPKMKEITYNWLNKNCGGLTKFETNSLPVDVFFIDNSIKGRELFFNYNKKRKLIIVYPYVEYGVNNAIRDRLPNYSYNRDVQLDLIGDWFSDKFNYPINPHAVYVPFTDITEKIYSQYLTETQSHNFNKIYKLIDNYVNQQDIEVVEMDLELGDSLLYVYYMPNRNNETLMLYNSYEKKIGVQDKTLLNLLTKNFNYTNTVLEIIFKKWYEKKYNKPVDSVLIYPTKK